MEIQRFVILKFMISIVTLAKDNQDIIGKFLSHLEGFDEVILIDTGSTDDTLEIAKKFSNVKIFKKSLSGFGDLRNLGASFAKNDWILALDTDETLSNKLLEFFKDASIDPEKVYSFPFHNYYNGKWIKGCGWHPEKHTRLYNRGKTKFSSARVHEGILLENVKQVDLPYAIRHDSYRNIDDFLDKMHRYSTLFALQNQGKKNSSFAKALSHGIFAFVKSYFLKRGIFDGKEGFIISFYNAETAYYKYLKLTQLNKQ